MLDKTRQRQLRHARLDGPVHPGPNVEATLAEVAKQGTTTSDDAAVDAAKKKLALSTDKTPVGKAPAGGSSSTQALQLAQVRMRRGVDGRLSDEQRKLLRTAYKELSRPRAGLDDHLALRAVAGELGVTAAFDEILCAHADRLLPELLGRADLFVGPDRIRGLAGIAEAMGVRTSFDAHVTALLVVARSWCGVGDTSGGDRERARVEAFAQAVGLVLPSETDDAPGRVYEASPKHHVGTVQGGYVSPAPTHGQEVLDASVQVKSESSRRVGIDKDAHEYVVFDETVAGVFHAHTRTWNQLHPDMQQALIHAGLVARNGKLL